MIKLFKKCRFEKRIFRYIDQCLEENLAQEDKELRQQINAIRDKYEIIIDYLKKNGFDGLYNPDYECGCGLNDLYPCGFDSCSDCEPAYAHKFEDGEGCIK